MDRLGVLYYVGAFPSLSQSFVVNEISELHGRGHDVAVFAQDDPEEDVVHEEYETIDVPVHYASASYRDLPQLLSREPLRMGVRHATDGFLTRFHPKRIAKNLLLGAECAEFAGSLDFDVDVIHGHFASATRAGEILAARSLDVPCTVTVHAHEIFGSPNVGQVRYICEGVDHVVVPSEYNRRYLREEFGIRNEITVVPATTRVEKFESSGPAVENRLLSVARLVEKKGHAYAIEAVGHLVDRGYDVEYHVVGSGDRRELLERRVQEAGVEDHVEFLGTVSDERLRAELSEACVFVLPCVVAEDGDRDAVPVALKEAMAAGTACVSTTVSAIPELVTDGDDGLLVPPRDAATLAEAIGGLLDDPERRETIAANGRDTVYEEFDISDAVDALCEVFRSLR